MAFIPVMAGPSPAWELKLTGSMNWYYEFYNQMGSQGFFGPYNVDNGVGTATANLNFWWDGSHLAQKLWQQESSAGGSYFYVIMDPVLTINPAINLKGRYRLGQWNNPQTGYYLTWDSPGSITRSVKGNGPCSGPRFRSRGGLSEWGKDLGYLGPDLQYDGSGRPDHGITGFGRAPGAFGHGHCDSILIDLCRREGSISDSDRVQLDPYDLVVPQYFNHGDKSGAHTADLMAFVVYNNGPLQAGVLGSYANYHIGPEAPLRNCRRSTRGQDSAGFLLLPRLGLYEVQQREVLLQRGSRLAVLDRQIVRTGNLPRMATLAGFLPTPRYTEQWRVMAETGVMCGPAKISVLYRVVSRTGQAGTPL